MDSMDTRDVMTDEDEDVVPKSADTSAMDTDIERDMQRLDDDEDDEDEDVGMTEEEEEDDDESGVKPAASRTNKSPTKAKKKASRNTDDEGEDDEEDDAMKDDTADEEEEEPDEDEDEEEEEEEDEDKQEVEDESRVADQSKIDASDPKSMLRMIRSLPEEEARRHEQFRRSYFDRGAIKRIMAKAIQDCLTADKKVPVVTQVMAIVMAGMTKVFVGELTAEARCIMERNGETGPMEPRHLREAQRLYYKRRPLARGRNLRRLLR